MTKNVVKYVNQNAGEKGMKSKIVMGLVAVGMMASLANAGVVSKNGIAKDSATGLEWQDDTNTVTKQIDWEHAKQQCEDLNLGGKSDWRLPNIYELTTLLNNTKKEKPYIIDGFQIKESDRYWSSTTSEHIKNYLWYVEFEKGFVGDDPKRVNYYVRCVRAGQLKFDNLALLKKEGKIKVSQEQIDKLSPNTEKIKAKKEAQERVEREEQTKIRGEQKFQLGNSVCYSGFTNNSGWCGTIENIRGDKIQVEITKVNINGFLAMQLNASDCTGNKDIKYHDEGKLIWVSKSCVD